MFLHLQYKRLSHFSPRKIVALPATRGKQATDHDIPINRTSVASAINQSGRVTALVFADLIGETFELTTAARCEAALTVSASRHRARARDLF